jgi:tetratricopeptide (TPR) repeat protein
MTMMRRLIAAAVLLAASLPLVAQESTSSYEFILAKLDAGQGKYDQALSRIDRLIEKEPASADLLFERAMILIDAGRVERAESELRKVVTANPDFYDAQRVLGRMLLDRAGNDRAKVEDSLVHLQAAFRLNGDDLSTGAMLSQVLIGLNRLPDAEKTLSVLVERAPDQRSFNFTYAQVLTKLGRGNEAKKYLERTVTLDPAFGPAVMQLIDIYEKEDDWQRAAEVMGPIVEQDPLNLDLQRQQGLYWLRAGDAERARAAFTSLTAADPKDVRSLFFLAESLTDLERYDEADPIYRKLIAAAPEDADFLSSLALSQVAQKKFDEAAKTFKAVLALPKVPDNVSVLARTQLAFIALQKEQYDAAVDAARPVLLFHDKPNTQAINIAVEALRRAKKPREAIALLEPLTARFASDPFVNARMIEMLVRNGEKDKARAAAAAQSKLGMRNTVTAAEAFIQADDYPTAIAILRDASKAAPADVDLAFQLASAYERSGDHATAEKAFLAILEKNPEHAATLNYLGYMWADGNRNLDRAASMLERAVGQEPKNGAYLDSLGWAYYRQGKFDLALRFLTEATSLMPRDPTVAEHLADVYAKMGDSPKALDLYRRLLTMAPEQELEAQVKAKIAELEKKLASARQ